MVPRTGLPTVLVANYYGSTPPFNGTCLVRRGFCDASISLGRSIPDVCQWISPCDRSSAPDAAVHHLLHSILLACTADGIFPLGTREAGIHPRTWTGRLATFVSLRGTADRTD